MADTTFVSGTTIASSWLNDINDLKYLQNTATPISLGEIVFQLTSNTQLTIKVKGTDGVIRSANITLV